VSRRRTLPARLTRLVTKVDHMEALSRRIGAGAEAGLRGSDADWVRAANRSSRGGLDELVSQRRRALDRRISKVARKIIRRNSAKGLNRPLTPKELAGVLARRR